jgi:hypothetical protein
MSLALITKNITAMTQLLTPARSTDVSQTFCYFTNRTSHIQIVRISNIPGWFFERVVFPGEHLTFQASANACLEVYAADKVSSLLCDRIDCTRLLREKVN